MTTISALCLEAGLGKKRILEESYSYVVQLSNVHPLIYRAA